MSGSSEMRLTVRTMEKLISHALECIYSDQGAPFADVLHALVPEEKPDVATLARAYTAIRVATRLTDPLCDSDVRNAVEEYQKTISLIGAPCIERVRYLLKETAELQAQRMHLAILKGKLALRDDEYSYEAGLYRLQIETKGPPPPAKREKLRDVSSRMADLSRQIKSRELELLKESNPAAYNDRVVEEQALSLQAENASLENSKDASEALDLIKKMDLELADLLRTEKTKEASHIESTKKDDTRPPPQKHSSSIIITTLSGLAFCYLLGYSIGHQGWSALLWVPIGYVVALFAAAQIFLPLILALPRAVLLLFKKQIKIGVIVPILVTPLKWVLALGIGLFLVGFIFPKTADELYANAALNLSLNLGTLSILLSPISRKSRADFWDDFEKRFQKYYTEAFYAASPSASAARTESDSGHSVVDQDKEKLLRKQIVSAERDLELLENPETIYGFGLAYSNGDDCEKDERAARECFAIAAGKGLAMAQHALALMYENGQGGPQDYAEAIRFYSMAADQEYAASQNNLGTLYELGSGVAKSEDRAIFWYRKAAKNGDPNGHSNTNRLEETMERDNYFNIVGEVDAFLDTHNVHIGDSSLLPYPKQKAMYAVKWNVAYCEDGLKSTTDPALVARYTKLISNLEIVFTLLARDWHDIEPSDKEAVARLSSCKEFPDWALPLKLKYLNERAAAEEAYAVASQVMEDKVREEQKRSAN